MAIKPAEVGKPSTADRLRIDNLEDDIDGLLNKHDPKTPFAFSLNGPETCRQGKHLTRPQLLELQRRYDGWSVKQDYDRDGWYLTFVAKRSQ